MGEKKGNCLYIDTNHKWWLAEADSVYGEGEIKLLEEKTKEIPEYFQEFFIKFVNSIAPHIVFKEEGKEEWSGTDGRQKRAIYPEK